MPRARGWLLLWIGGACAAPPVADQPSVAPPALTARSASASTGAPAPRAATGAAPAGTGPAAAPPPGTPASSTGADLAEPPPEIGAWLGRNGVGRWQPDDWCFRRVGDLDVFDCRCSIEKVGGHELLACTTSRERPQTGRVPFVEELIVYAVAARRLEPLLRLPIGAAMDDCLPGLERACRLVLGTASEPDALVVRERTPGDCREAFATLGRWPGGPDRGARATYQRICASRGRYEWRAGRLTRPARRGGLPTEAPGDDQPPPAGTAGP